MSSKFMNLKEAVVEWAWKQFDLNATRQQKRLRDKEKRQTGVYIGVEIDWSDVRTAHETKWSALVDEICEGNNAGLSSEKTEGLPECPGTPQASVLFQTRFTNNTAETQEYTLRTEKTTRSSMSTTVESGFTEGCDMSVKLASPCQVFEANAGYKREVTLTNIDGETFEEELHWGVDSLIKVKSQHIAEATLVVDEKRQTGEFLIDTQLHGVVYVSFTALRNNNSLVKSVGHDVAEIVREYLERERRKGGGAALDGVQVKDDGKVHIKTRGSCAFRYGIKQHINVNQIPLTTTPQ